MGLLSTTLAHIMLKYTTVAQKTLDPLENTMTFILTLGRTIRLARPGKQNFISRIPKMFESIVQDRAGVVAEHKQVSIPKSDYLKRLDEGDDDGTEILEQTATPSFRPKYWSDFNRMYYIPRSVHLVPNLASLGLEESRSPWSTGREIFQHYDTVSRCSLMIYLSVIDCVGAGVLRHGARYAGIS